MTQANTPSTPDTTTAAVSLPVLGQSPPSKRTRRRSKMGPRRAAVLILIHLAIAAHIIHWKIAGRTLSPVEPSESMQTLNNGLVNAGFIFFALALLSTLIVGRFFCGWGCHIVALQDLCAWMLKKIGIRPAPFYSRLLMFAPLILALYMFVWPSLKRLIAPPIAGWSPTLGAWLGPVARIPEEGFTNHLITDDFWASFASVPIAIPFLLVCGFATVYFLGAKGFCTYGCPYGGFFAPIDLVAPGRIVVDHDKCEGCGHCTAVCTSNVRVHEEIRDHGMVVDPGCMKCMDCVSVCPNEALSFAFRKPALAKGKYKGEAARSHLDTTPAQDLILAAVFIIVFLGSRGQYGVIPMLMAMGLASIAAFLAYKCMTLVSRRDVRAVRLQIKRAGKLTHAGIGFVIVMALLAALALHSLVINSYKWRGQAIYNTLMPDATTLATTLAAGVPSDQAQQARAGAERFERTLSMRSHSAGLGLFDNADARADASVLRLMAGDAEQAEQLIAPLSASPNVPVTVVTYHARLLAALQRSPEALELLRNRISQRPRDWEARELRASILMPAGNGPPDEVRAIIDEATTALDSGIPRHDTKARARTLVTLAMAQRALAQPQEAMRNAERAAELAPTDRICLESLARLQFFDARDPAQSAITWRRVFDLNRKRLDTAIELARMLTVSGQTEAATIVFDEAQSAGANTADTALAQMSLGIELFRWQPDTAVLMIRAGYARAPADERVAALAAQIRAGAGIDLDE